MPAASAAALGRAAGLGHGLRLQTFLASLARAVQGRAALLIAHVHVSPPARTLASRFAMFGEAG